MEKMGRDLWMSPTTTVNGDQHYKYCYNHTFVGIVVQVEEIRLPVVGKRRSIHSITMILTSNVATSGSKIQGRNVVRTISILQLHSASSCCERQQLVSEADAKDGDLRGVHELA